MRIPPNIYKKINHLADFLVSDSGIHLIIFVTFIGKTISYIPGEEIQSFEHPYEIIVSSSDLAKLWGVLAVLNFIAAFYCKTWYTSSVFAISMSFLFIWGFGYSFANNVYIANLGMLHIGYMSMALLAVARGRRGVLTNKREDAHGSVA